MIIQLLLFLTFLPRHALTLPFSPNPSIYLKQSVPSYLPFRPTSQSSAPAEPTPPPAASYQQFYVAILQGRPRLQNLHSRELHEPDKGVAGVWAACEGVASDGGLFGVCEEVLWRDGHEGGCCDGC